MKLGAKKIEYD